MKSRCLRNVATTLLLAGLSFGMTGCNVAGSRAAAITAGVLLGVGVGAQVATHSSVEVKIDVYEPSAADDHLFKLNHALAVRQVIDGGPKKPNSAKLVSAEKDLEPKMDALNGNLTEINASILQVAAWVATASAPDSEITVLLSDLKTVAKHQADAWQVWLQFKDAIGDAAADNFPENELQNAADKLKSLRKSLRDITRVKLQNTTVAFLKSQIQAVFHSRKLFQAADLTKIDDFFESFKPDPSKTVDDQIMEILDGARAAAVANTDQASVIDSLKLAADPTNQTKAASIKPAIATATQDLKKVLTGIFSVKYSQETSESAITIVIDALTAGVNLGPISNEVMQFVVAKRNLISRITRDSEENEARWHCFTRCFSQGGTGNNDTVFYMENMALPVLKSATFDPSKFLAADGSIYKQALAALGAAAGQKVTAANNAKTAASTPGTGAAAGGTSDNGAAPASGATGGNGAAAPQSNIQSPRDSSDNGNSTPATGAVKPYRPAPTVTFAVLDASAANPTPSSAPAATVPAATVSGAPAPVTPNSPATNADQSSPTTPAPSATPGDGTGSSATTDADALKIANNQIAAVRKAKLDALRQILDQQKAIAAAQSDQTKWKDATSGPATLKAVTTTLTNASGSLRAASKATGQ